MWKILTNEEFLQNLIDRDVMDKPLEEYKGSSIKMLWECHINKNHVYNATPDSLYRGKHCCPYCQRKTVFVGETDMWSTNPEMASMLHNPDEGYKYFATSSHKTDWNCPRCGTLVKNKIINNVRMFGLCCPNCYDGMSFGEKFIADFLDQLGCKYIYNKKTDWSENRRYDFRIPKMSLIIEVHGIQHFEQSFLNYDSKKDSRKNARTLEEEVNNDCFKRNLAKCNGIEHYVELDCRYSELDYIRTSILNSELFYLFDLSIIDWNRCLKATFASNVVLCANLWNDGMKSSQDIAETIGIDKTSAISYLKKAAKVGLCDYVKNYKKNRNRYKPVLCEETGVAYECIQRVKDDGYCATHVSQCCNKKVETAHGMHWRFI